MSDSHPLGSPPTYEAGPPSHPYPPEKSGSHTKTKKGYISVPLGDDVNEVGATTSSADLFSLGLKADRGVFTGVKSRDLDEESLASFLLSQEIPAPRMYMQITGHCARTAKYEPEEGLQAFSFSVPLPRCHHSQGSLFAFADDVPCLRGNSVAYAGNEETFLAKASLPKSWKISAQSDKHEVYQAGNDACLPATKESVQQMNARLDQIILPPWLPLGRSWSQMWQEGQAPGRVVDATAIKKALGQFLHIRPQAWCRWLIIPQTAYGWDVHLIEEELNKLLNQSTGVSSWFPSSSRAVVRISARLGAIDGGHQPALAFRLFETQPLKTLYRYLRIQVEPGIAFTSLLGILCLILLLIVGLNYRIGNVSITTFNVLLLLLPLFVMFLSTILLLKAREAVFCNIGMAWALKSWKPTNIPASNSRQEVMDEIRQRNASLSEIPEDEIILQRRPDGWYLMTGSREGDWINANRQIIEKAIFERKNGLLDAASINELDMVRQRLAQYESDDAVGINEDSRPR